MPQDMAKRTRMRLRACANCYCGFAPTLATEPLCEPKWSSHTSLLLPV